MSNGVLLFAHNNHKIDYVKQAVFCAKKIKKHLKLPVALATDSKSYFDKRFKKYGYIDIVIENTSNTNQKRTFHNGPQSESLPWNNLSRCESLDITPFENTIVMDTDFFVGNSILLKCFEDKTFKITKNIVDLNPNRRDITLDRISNTSIDMYWATVFYFNKNKFSKMFFELVKHIKKNWNFYRLQYQLVGKNFRNDYAFTIALHLLGYPNTDLPCKIFFTTDKDKLLEIDKEKYKLHISNMDKDIVGAIENVNIHIMNKFDLSTQIDRILQNE